MPAVAALEKRRAQLESKKQALLSKVEQCTKRLENIRAIRKVQHILWDSSESDVEESAPPPSEELLERLEHLNMKLQATQELCGVDELTVEAVVLEQRPEQVDMIADEESGGGIWREVSARGRIEYVPFQMKFLLYENAQKALHYRSVTTSVTKPQQTAELCNTILHSCKTPSEAVHCLVLYSKVYKERRDAMLALNERYRDDVSIQTTECGGYQVSCFDVLEIEWLLVGGTTALDPFRHRFLMSCDDDGDLVENYLRILKDTYKILKDPKNNSVGRMRCLCKIIDICLQVYRNSIVQNTELDADADEMINRGRKSARELESNEQEERKIRDVEETDENKNNNRKNYQNIKDKINSVTGNRENKLKEKKTSENNQRNIQKKNVEKVQENTEHIVKNKQKCLANGDASQKVGSKFENIEREERKIRGVAGETDKKKENKINNDQNNKIKINNVLITEYRENKVQEKKIQQKKSSETNQRNMQKKNVEKVQENTEKIVKNKQTYRANGDEKHNCIEDKNNRHKENETELEAQSLKVPKSTIKHNAVIAEKKQRQAINGKEKTRETMQEHRQKKAQEKKNSETNERNVQKKNVKKVQENPQNIVKNKQKDLANGDASQNVARELQKIEKEDRKIRNAKETDKKKEDNRKNDQTNKNKINNLKMTERQGKILQEKKSSEINQNNKQMKNVEKVQEITEIIVKNKQKEPAHGDASQNVAREIQNIEQKERMITDPEETDKKKEDNRKNDQNNKNKINNLKMTENREKKVQEKKSSEINQRNTQKKNVEKVKENTKEIFKNKQIANCDAKLSGAEDKNNSNKENETELPLLPLKVTKNGIKKNAEIPEKSQRKEIISTEKTREELDVAHKSTAKGKLKDNIINKEQIRKGTNSNLVKPTKNAIQKEKINKKQNKESQKCHPFGMDIPLSPIRKVASAVNVISEPFETENGHLSILGKRKANTTEILKTKIPRMVPTQMIKKFVTPRRSPRKPFAANKGKGFFFGNK